MMMMDWLALPGDEVAEKTVEPASTDKTYSVQGAEQFAPPVVRPIEDDEAPIEVQPEQPPAVMSERNAIIDRVWRALTKWQRAYLDALEENDFNSAATLRSLGDDAPGRATVSRWKREPDFSFILKVRKTTRAAELLEKNSLVLEAGHIREAALKPKPILHQGVPTGHYENKPDIALRANEQLAKLGGHLKGDDGPTQAQGPALLIQVVQAGGQIVDITPRGVTIDLPAPNGA